MALNIDHEVAVMKQMTVGELKLKFAEVHHGEEPRSRNKQWMIKRIAWRMQANEEGGLSERALRRAAELANIADLRLTAPKPSKNSPPPDADRGAIALIAPLDPRLPSAGTLITRRYKGQTLCVKVLAAGGFEFEGERYKSLSAVARRITGAAWNGFLFFNLIKKGAEA